MLFLLRLDRSWSTAGLITYREFNSLYVKSFTIYLWCYEEYWSDENESGIEDPVYLPNCLRTVLQIRALALLRKSLVLSTLSDQTRLLVSSWKVLPYPPDSRFRANSSRTEMHWDHPPPKGVSIKLKTKSIKHLKVSSIQFAISATRTSWPLSTRVTPNINDYNSATLFRRKW